MATCPEGPLPAWYDQILVLDAEGCPPAFIEAHGIRIELSRLCQLSYGLLADMGLF